MYKKKSLGQHFLHGQTYLRAIVDAGEVREGDTVLEIGPGDGALTQELLIRGAKVVAIEKDRRLIPILQEKFAAAVQAGTLVLHEGDALETHPEELGLHEHHYKLIANIPYYITGTLLRKFLSETIQPSTLVFLIQKEVAERIARDKKESLLSLSVKAYGEAKYAKTVPRGAFTPPPTVDSAILTIRHVSREKFINTGAEEFFFRLLKAGFSKKRKLLKNNLTAIGEEGSVVKSFEKIGISEKARAEDLPLEIWLRLANLLYTEG